MGFIRTSVSGISSKSIVSSQVPMDMSPYKPYGREKKDLVELTLSSMWSMLCPYSALMWSVSAAKAMQRTETVIQWPIPHLSSRHDSGPSDQIAAFHSTGPSSVCSVQ